MTNEERAVSNMTTRSVRLVWIMDAHGGQQDYLVLHSQSANLQKLAM